MAIKLILTLNRHTGRFGPNTVEVGAYPTFDPRDRFSIDQRTISFNMAMQLDSSGLVAEVTEKDKSAKEAIDDLTMRFGGEVVYRAGCTILATFRPETAKQLQSYLKRTYSS